MDKIGEMLSANPTFTLFLLFYLVWVLYRQKHPSE